MSGTKAILEKEFQRWDKDYDDNSIDLQLAKSAEDNTLAFSASAGEETRKFNIIFPPQYPNSSTDRFVLASTDDSLSQWIHDMNTFIEKKPTSLALKTLLSKLCEEWDQAFNNGEDEDDGEDVEEEEEVPGLDMEEPIRPKPKQQQHVDVSDRKFMQNGSPAATLRLIQDLKNIAREDPKSLGFSAVPVKEGAMENLYHWDVRFFGFDEKSPLGKDVKTLKEKSGQDYIKLEMKFPKDYPMIPPFVRVVSPKFAFRTGHVTVGGSICMELLTLSGWSASNDIESILIQIRAEMMEGGAQLDKASLSNPNNSYSEREAWEAFYRAAKGHNWMYEGLGPDKFPGPTA